VTFHTGGTVGLFEFFIVFARVHKYNSAVASFNIGFYYSFDHAELINTLAIMLRLFEVSPVTAEAFEVVGIVFLWLT
jgi:hypothetical protein